MSGHSQASVEVVKEHGKPNLLKGVMFPEGGTDLGDAGLQATNSTTFRFLS